MRQATGRDAPNPTTTYNHLNLPTKIKFASGGKIEYLYDALGKKERKTVRLDTITVVTDYLDGYQYKNAVLDFFPHAEGYVKMTHCGGCDEDNQFNYVYQYKDHLGNIRLSYGIDPGEDNEEEKLKVIEEDHYYPFGLKHTQYNTGVKEYDPFEGGITLNPIEPGGEVMNKYKYNGKEYQNELGLNMYDYGARNYDPALGRWMNIDPKAEEYRRWSPYNYCIDNPMRFVDPDGMGIDNIFQVDKKGKITEVQAEGEDVLVRVDRKGREIGDRVNIGDDANLRQMGNVQFLEISDPSKAKEAFTELAENSKREFALVNTENTATGDKNSVLVGDGKRSENSGDIIAKGFYDGFDNNVVTDITHNHPGNSPPSGYDPETGENLNPDAPIGDARNATTYPTNSNGQPITRSVYTAKDNKTYTYDKDKFSTPNE